ncbi:MAG: lipocalin family protein [Desulfuromonadales bacterium]|nr:lipocalin family protein [Desulfuromonadales bacterium]MBN2792515.1 lipocalin family protein [Desulfuromonadales bacterium]
MTDPNGRGIKISQWNFEQSEDRLKKFLLLISALLLPGCLNIPEKVQPVTGFELERYLGRWYEIARLDHPFEKGLTRVTADYSRKKDGGVLVVNRGFSETQNTWKEARGRAYFVNTPAEGYLKVSFFGPFYGSYVIFELDRDNYRYAFISGPDTDYLWLLARTPTVEPQLIDRFIGMAWARGFDTDNLIFVNQNGSP